MNDRIFHILMFFFHSSGHHDFHDVYHSTSSYFQVLQSLYQFFGNSTKNTSYNWYHPHSLFFFQFPRQVLLLLFFRFLSLLTNAQPKQRSSLFSRFLICLGFFLLFCFFVFFFFLLTIDWLSLPAEIRHSVYISKSQMISCVSFSWMNSGQRIYHFFVWSNLNILQNSQWINFPTQSCLFL